MEGGGGVSEILCCGMIRSGSTVLYQIASAIVELRGIGHRCGYYEPPHQPPATDHQPPAWSVYKVPWLCHREKELLRDGGAIGIYSYRDLNEALKSAYRAFKVPEGDRWLHRALTEAHIKEVGRLGDSFARQFRSRGFPAGWHSIHFDQIRDCLPGVVGMVSEWIPGRDLASEEIDAIAADLALERQKARPKIAPFDPETLLLANHFGE